MVVINQERGVVAFEWSIADVRYTLADRNIRFKKESLTNEECFSVLCKVITNHDPYDGINYDIIEFWIFALYRSRISNGRDSTHGYYR